MCHRFASQATFISDRISGPSRSGTHLKCKSTQWVPSFILPGFASKIKCLSLKWTSNFFALNFEPWNFFHYRSASHSDVSLVLICNCDVEHSCCQRASCEGSFWEAGDYQRANVPTPRPRSSLQMSTFNTTSKGTQLSLSDGQIFIAIQCRCFWVNFLPKNVQKCTFWIRRRTIDVQNWRKQNLGLFSSTFNVERPFQRYWAKITIFGPKSAMEKQ